MNISIVAPFAMYPKGTVSVRALPIAKALVDRGHNVSIIVPPFDNIDESGKFYEIGGVAIYNVKCHRQVKPALKYIPDVLHITKQLIKKTVELNPDIIYIFKPKAFSGIVGLYFEFLDKNYPLILDSDDWEGRGGWNDLDNYPKIFKLFFECQEKWVSKYANCVTVASKTLEERMHFFGIPPESVLYLPNGPNQLKFNIEQTFDDSLLKKRYDIGDDTPIILLYTRFFEFKIEKIITILKLVLLEIPNAILLVVGKGFNKEENKLLELANKENIENSIIYTGWIQPDEIQYYLSSANVAIYPFDDTILNRSKCPVKLIDLMLMQCAIVADAVGQITEYIENGKSGILVKPDDIESFAKNVIAVLSNEKIQEMLGKSAKERIWNNFGWDIQVKKLEHVLYKLVD